MPVRPAIFDGYVLAIDITGFLQTLKEGPDRGRESIRRSTVEKSDHRHGRLLRVRYQRPRRRRAAEKTNKISPL
ncbi:MAG: hypothetical protein WA712_21200, partial [Pseudolabrys sp.]